MASSRPRGSSSCSATARWARCIRRHQISVCTTWVCMSWVSIPPTCCRRCGRGNDKAAHAAEKGPMKRQLHLNLFFHSRGHHEASWRHPATSPLALTDIRYYQDLERRYAAALFDSIFLADQLALGEGVDHAARTSLEPGKGLGAVA